MIRESVILIWLFWAAGPGSRVAARILLSWSAAGRIDRHRLSRRGDR